MRLIHKDSDDVDRTFYCNEVTNSVQVAILIGQPIKDNNSRFITDSDIDFKIDDVVIRGVEIKRITDIPELKPIADNNSRRGTYRKVKVIVTT
jgi:hypothetical protein